MDKLQMAHEYAMQHLKNSGGRITMASLLAFAWEYADAMQAEADKRAEQKRKEIREMLNADNTFIEKEGQHFDDVEWQPDWSQAPDWATAWSHDRLGSHWWDSAPKKGFDMWIPSNSNSYKYDESPDFNYQGNWKESLRKRPEASFEVDWCVAPEWAVAWTIDSGEILWWSYKPELKNGYWFVEDSVVWQCAEAPSFGFTGSHIVERPHDL